MLRDQIFEQGRQDALCDLEKSVNRWLKFTESLKGVTENMAYSEEKREGMIIVYKDVISAIGTLKDKERLSHLIGVKKLEDLKEVTKALNAMFSSIPDKQK